MYSALFVCLLIAATVVYSHPHDPVIRQNVLLKHPGSQLVITETEQGKVIVHKYVEKDLQVWNLEPTLKGTFFIINKASGKALQKAHDGQDAITVPFDECRVQQWYFNSNNTINNAQHGRYLDIKAGVYKNGTPLIVYENRGSRNQVFVVEDL